MLTLRSAGRGSSLPICHSKSLSSPAGYLSRIATRSGAQHAKARQPLAQIPVLAVTSEASNHAGYDHCTVDFLRQVRRDGVTHLRLQKKPAFAAMGIS